MSTPAAEPVASTWRITRMTGYRISHPYIAVTPGCPTERHPTRDCRCTVFRTLEDAETYVDRQAS